MLPLVEAPSIPPASTPPAPRSRLLLTVSAGVVVAGALGVAAG
jgi:hypothetical protein